MMLRITRMTVTNKPVTGESTKETVKTIARGMPDVSGVTVVTNSRVFHFPREAAGASSARHSLRSLILEGQLVGKTRANGVAGRRGCDQRCRHKFVRHART